MPTKWSRKYSGLLDIEEIGFDEQIEKLERFNEIVRPIMRQASRQSIQYIVGGWKSVVPVLSGQYLGSIVGDVKYVVGLETIAKASTDVVAGGNVQYPYPFMLESSSRFPKTKGKVRRVLQAAKGQVEGYFAEALEKIVSALEVH